MVKERDSEEMSHRDGLRLGSFKLTREGIYRKAPPSRGWIWDLIISFKRTKKEDNHLKFKSYNFKSFFDNSTGQTVWNMSQIKDEERKGRVFLKPDEAERIANKARKEIELKDRKRFREELRPMARKIARMAR